MYQVEKINSIDKDIFNSIYENDKERLSAYIGFDDVDRYRLVFESISADSLLFKISDGDAVKGYVVGFSDNTDAVIINMITASSDTIANFVEPSAVLLKSLGFVNVVFYSYTDNSTYSFIKNNLNRDDVYQYLSELMIESVAHIKLRLV